MKAQLPSEVARRSISASLAPFLIGVAVALGARVAVAQVGVARPGVLCSPLSWDAVVPGITTDSHLKRLYGKGHFSSQGGHVGTRHYVNRDHSVTVDFELGVDYIVETVTVSTGVHLPKGANVRTAESPHIPMRESFFGVSLGATEQVVRQALGDPSSNSTSTALVYRTDYGPTECIAAQEATFTFAAGRLQSVSLHTGD
jgi:hypothetical protein